MTDPLKLRGAIAILSRALFHIGINQKTDEWGTGDYLNPAVEEADGILRKALWLVQDDLEKYKKWD